MLRGRTQRLSGDGAGEGWGVNISTALPGKSRDIPSGWGGDRGRAESRYLKDGGHGFIQVIIVTWLLGKDVS